jgi:hypothetical protein
MFLVRNFIDEATLRRLQERYPLSKPEERPLFHPLQILNLLRICLAISTEDPTQTPDTNEELRYKLGSACLMMSDLILSEEEILRITTGTENEQRIQLMTQVLPAFELLNAAKPQHQMLRSNVVFRVLLRDEKVRKDIADKCRGFDFERQFEKTAQISLSKWLGLVFSTYAYYMGRTENDLVEHPEFFIINRKSFISKPGATQVEMDSYLATVSFSIEELSAAIAEQRPADPRFDFVPFRNRPLFALKDGNFACIDPTFLIEKYYAGVHWTIHDRIHESKRNDLFKAWGMLFEHYVQWLLIGMERSPGRFFPFPKWDNGEESFDGAFLKGDMFIPMEYKGGFLSQAAKYSQRADLLIPELERKFVLGCQQIVEKLAAVFHPDPSRKRRLADIRVDQVKRVLPLLIVQESAFSGPLLNWWLNMRFCEILASHPLSDNVEVLPLNVVHIDVMETLVETTETVPGFDFIYALHHKAVRDTQMIDNLHNFMFTFPGYAKQRAPRMIRLAEEVEQEMISYLFPRESKVNDTG